MSEYLSRKQVAERLSTADRPVSSKTVYRWESEGVKVGKRRVKLKSIRLPTGRAFTPELVDEFVAAINGISAPSVPAAAPGRSAVSLSTARRLSSPIARCSDDEIGQHPRSGVPVVRSA